MDRFYFEWPGRSYNLYSLPSKAATEETTVVRLPSGQLVSLTYSGKTPPVVTEVHQIWQVWEAELVTSTRTGCFSGDWGKWIEAMEAAAYLNIPLTIAVSPGEYQRLQDGGLEELKRQVSENLAPRMRLDESFPVADDTEMPALLVLRYGSCP